MKLRATSLYYYNFGLFFPDMRTDFSILVL